MKHKHSNNKKQVNLEFELPGFKEKDIKVRLTKNTAVVSAAKKHEKKTQEKDYYHEEQSYTSFSYATTLPNIDTKKAKTQFKNGVLQIKAPNKK